MDDIMVTWKKNIIKEGLAKLPADNQLLFKRMYSKPNGTNGPDISASIDYVVDHMDTRKLDWAFLQVQRTLANLHKHTNN